MNRKWLNEVQLKQQKLKFIIWLNP